MIKKLIIIINRILLITQGNEGLPLLMKCVPSNRELLTDSEYHIGFSPSSTKNF